MKNKKYKGEKGELYKVAYDEVDSKPVYKKWSEKNAQERWEEKGMRTATCPKCKNTVAMPHLHSLESCGCGWKKPIIKKDDKETKSK